MVHPPLMGHQSGDLGEGLLPLIFLPLCSSSLCGTSRYQQVAVLVPHMLHQVILGGEDGQAQNTPVHLGRTTPQCLDMWLLRWTGALKLLPHFGLASGRLSGWTFFMCLRSFFSLDKNFSQFLSCLGPCEHSSSGCQTSSCLGSSSRNPYKGSPSAPPPGNSTSMAPASSTPSLSTTSQCSSPFSLLWSSLRSTSSAASPGPVPSSLNNT